MKNIYCTLDTETFGGASRPKGIYHLGGIVHDRQCQILGTFNILVAEHFHEIAVDDYAKKNFDRYMDMVANGTCTMVATEDEAIAVVDHLLDYYGANVLMAFNTGFDYCKTACRALLTEGREFVDIYLMACQCLATSTYADFCREHDLLSRSKKCVATSAESFYAYLTNNPEYSEEHTAFEDSLIEMAIFAACIKTHKRFTRNCHFYDYEGKWGLIPPATPTPRTMSPFIEAVMAL